MGRIAGFVLFVGIVFALITLQALEGLEVVVLHTGTREAPHTTRTWIADEPAGTLLIEAANPDRPFLHDLQENPALEVDRGGNRLRCRATALPNPDGHDRIRRLLAERYGWADRWIALLADTSDSSAVRLTCE